MEPVVAARVNDALEKIRRSKGALEARSEELSRSTAESERQMMEWAREVITIDHRHLSAFISGVSELEESCGKEQQKERYSRQKAEGNARETEQFRQKANELHEEVAKLRITHDELPIEEKNLSDKINDGEQRFNERQAYVNQKQRRLQKEVDELLFRIRQYRSILGLKMETIGTNLSMVFQFINRNDVAQEYRVVISNTKGHFKELDDLNARLSSGGGLKAFITDLRSAFVSFANSAE